MSVSQAIVHLRETLAAIEQARTFACRTLPFEINAVDERLATGGLRVDALHEFASAQPDWGDDAAALLFLAGVAARTDGVVLWIVRHRDLFAPGLHQVGLTSRRLLHAQARDDAEVLAVMEDALRHRGLGAVIGEVRTAGMTATRRLQLAAEGGPAMALLLRQHVRARGDPLAHPSAAATRWRIGSLPSAPLPVAGVGRSRWHVALVRQRGGAPFDIELEACDETGRCALAAELVDRPDLAVGADTRAVA
jgi:protein ImuA